MQSVQVPLPGSPGALGATSLQSLQSLQSLRSLQSLQNLRTQGGGHPGSTSGRGLPGALQPAFGSHVPVRGVAPQSSQDILGTLGSLSCLAPLPPLPSLPSLPDAQSLQQMQSISTLQMQTLQSSHSMHNMQNVHGMSVMQPMQVYSLGACGSIFSELCTAEEDGTIDWAQAALAWKATHNPDAGTSEGARCVSEPPAPAAPGRDTEAHSRSTDDGRAENVDKEAFDSGSSHGPQSKVVSEEGHSQHAHISRFPVEQQTEAKRVAAAQKAKDASSAVAAAVAKARAVAELNLKGAAASTAAKTHVPAVPAKGDSSSKGSEGGSKATPSEPSGVQPVEGTKGVDRSRSPSEKQSVVKKDCLSRERSDAKLSRKRSSSREAHKQRSSNRERRRSRSGRRSSSKGKRRRRGREPSPKVNSREQTHEEGSVDSFSVVTQEQQDPCRARSGGELEKTPENALAMIVEDRTMQVVAESTVPDWVADLVQPVSFGPPALQHGDSWFKAITILAHQVGHLIGPRGVSISEIRSQSGADIKIDHGRGRSFGTVTITGNVHLAERLIYERLASCRATSS